MPMKSDVIETTDGAYLIPAQVCAVKPIGKPSDPGGCYVYTADGQRHTSDMYFTVVLDKIIDAARLDRRYPR